MAWSLLIRNGTVVDGSGAPARAADVAVEGDRIAAVGPGLAGEAARVIDAKGLMVAPGFIDIHSHSDLVYDKCPSAESKVRQGVTTEVVGHVQLLAGAGRPGPRGSGAEWAGGIGGKIARSPGTPSASTSITCAALGTSVNIVQFVGHGALRLAAVGADGAAGHRPTSRRAWSGCSRRRSTPAPSASPPGSSTRRASTATPRSWSRSPAAWRAAAGSTSPTSAARRPRSSRRPRRRSRSARRAACRCRSPTSRPRAARTGARWTASLRMIDGARARGVDVTGDVYPYPAGSTKMDNLLPAWMHDGGISKLLERLTDPKARQRAIARLPGGRRALAHRLGRHRLGRDHDRHLLAGPSWPASTSRSWPGAPARSRPRP